MEDIQAGFFFGGGGVAWTISEMRKRLGEGQVRGGQHRQIQRKVQGVCDCKSLDSCTYCLVIVLCSYLYYLFTHVIHVSYHVSGTLCEVVLFESLVFVSIKEKVLLEFGALS